MNEQNIVLLCEGKSENAILDLLLDNDLLVFTRDQLFTEEVIKGMRDFRKFQNEYLEGISVNEKLKIFRVQDDKPKSLTGHEVTPLPHFRHLIESVEFIITRPEIEMLMIIYNDLEEKYNRYIPKARGNTTAKPSTFLKEYSKEFKRCKDYHFVYSHFDDIPKLLESIRKYHDSHKHKMIKKNSSLILSFEDIIKTQ